MPPDADQADPRSGFGFVTELLGGMQHEIFMSIFPHYLETESLIQISGGISFEHRKPDFDARNSRVSQQPLQQRAPDAIALNFATELDLNYLPYFSLSPDFEETERTAVIG